MDRFNSNEDVEFESRSFTDGGDARAYGFSRDACPGREVYTDWQQRSWRAGWADTDATMKEMDDLLWKVEGQLE
jgi:ribosome modulation factor